MCFLQVEDAINIVVLRLSTSRHGLDLSSVCGQRRQSNSKSDACSNFVGFLGGDQKWIDEARRIQETSTRENNPFVVMGPDYKEKYLDSYHNDIAAINARLGNAQSYDFQRVNSLLSCGVTFCESTRDFKEKENCGNGQGSDIEISPVEINGLFHET